MLTEQEQKQLKEIWNNSILEFVKFFFSHFLTSKIPDFHKEIYKLLSQYKRLVIASPRGFAKSTICSVFYPLWCALFGKKQDICIISASENLAVEWVRKIKREIEQNQIINSFWGNLKTDKWSETHFIVNNRKFGTQTHIRAKGAGGQIRGFRPDLVILDDIETDETVASEDQRKKLREWLFKACLNTLLPEGQIILIGTIISPLSLLSYLLEADNDWQKHRYRAYLDEQKEGNELWKDLWTHKRLQERKKEIGSWAFASEYMNDPISDETAPVKQEQIRYWQDLPDKWSCVISVDPAYKDDETADYKVASLIAIDPNQNRYLVNYIRTHNPSGEFINAILNTYLQYKTRITSIGVPMGGAESQFYKSLLERAQQRKLFPPFAEVKNIYRGNRNIREKTARIIATLQPLFEIGKYYIHKSHIEAKEELLTIGRSRHDDIVDTLAYAEQILQPVYYEIPEEQKFIDRDRYGIKKPVLTNYGYEI